MNKFLFIESDHCDPTLAIQFGLSVPFSISLMVQNQEMHHTIFNWVLCEGDGLLPSEVSAVDLFSIYIFSAHIKTPHLVSTSLS